MKTLRFGNRSIARGAAAHCQQPENTTAGNTYIVMLATQNFLQMKSQVFNTDCLAAMREMPDNAFDLAVVDPVYGGVTQGGYMKNAGHTRIGGYETEYHTALWKQEKTGAEYFAELFRISKNQVIWGGNYFQKVINQDSQCWLVWDKLNDNSKYADCELAWTSFNSATRIFRFTWDGFRQQDMKNKEKRIHPTQKPVALYAWIFRLFAKPGMQILDTHLGSGSSRLAAWDAGLDFTGYEIDKTYFDLQEQRFQNYIAQDNLFWNLEGEEK